MNLKFLLTAVSRKDTRNARENLFLSQSFNQPPQNRVKAVRTGQIQTNRTSDDYTCNGVEWKTRWIQTQNCRKIDRTECFQCLLWWLLLSKRPRYWILTKNLTLACWTMLSHASIAVTAPRLVGICTTGMCVALPWLCWLSRRASCCSYNGDICLFFHSKKQRTKFLLNWSSTLIRGLEWIAYLNFQKVCKQR